MKDTNSITPAEKPKDIVRKCTLSRFVKNAINPPNPVDNPAIRVSAKANMMFSYSIFCVVLFNVMQR